MTTFFVLSGICFSQGNYDQLKKFIKSDDYVNAGKTLQKILAKEDIPDIKAWLKCGDIYLEARKYFSALIMYATAKSNFDLVADAMSDEEIGFDEDDMERIINTKLKAVFDALKLPPTTLVFNENNEQTMPDEKYYLFLAETGKTPNDSIAAKLPQPYITSETGATVESHLEEMADMIGAQNDDDNGDAANNGEVEEEVYVEPKSFTEVDVDPFIDLEKLYKSIIYPTSAKTKHIEGVVIVNILVDEEGNPVKCEVVRSDNNILNQAAIDALMKSKFKPALLNNEPVPCWIDIPVEFKLK